MRCERLLNQAMQNRLTLLALFIILSISIFGCRPLMDLPLTPEANPVNSSPDEGPLMQTELPGRTSMASPVRKKGVTFVPNRIESNPVLQVSIEPEGIAPVPADRISAAAVLGELPDAHALTLADIQRVAPLNVLEKDGASIDISEVIIFLVVGVVFLLVHLSMRRPARPSPDPALAKLLHTRPWR
jgi:hypothetical protein